MKLLVISNLFPPHYLGGYELVCAETCAWLRTWGHQVTVLTSDERLPELADPDQPEVWRRLRLIQTFARPIRGSLRWQRWRADRHNRAVTRQALESLRPDAILVFSQLRLTPGPARLAEASGLPVLYAINDEHLVSWSPVPFRAGWRALAGAMLDRTAGRHLTWRGLRWERAVCISQHLQASLVRQGLPLQRARVVPQGIELKDFPCKAEPGQLNRPLRLLFVGFLHAHKGVHLILQAARGFSACPLAITIVGEGPLDYLRHLRELAASCGHPVRFLGRRPRSELPELYRSQDVFVFPSTPLEASGLTVLEAMASGLPVLATRRGGHAEIARDGETALLFENEDAPGLRQRLEDLCNRPELAVRLARQARAYVEGHHAQESYAKGLERQLMDAVEERQDKGLRALFKRVLPSSWTRWIQTRRFRTCRPPVGFVWLGALRRVEPISRVWGHDRGTPINRRYIEDFLEQHRECIRGVVLEVEDDRYIRKFGRDVERAEILHALPGNPKATLVADLSDAAGIPDASYDCLILTQVHMYIYDLPASVAHILRILKPGGTVLVTLSGLEKVSSPDMQAWGDYWRFTSASARRLFASAFGAEQVEVRSYGNVLAASASLFGLSQEDLRPDELDYQDPEYEVIIGVRARKAQSDA